MELGWPSLGSDGRRSASRRVGSVHEEDPWLQDGHPLEDGCRFGCVPRWRLARGPDDPRSHCRSRGPRTATVSEYCPAGCPNGGFANSDETSSSDLQGTLGDGISLGIGQSVTYAIFVAVSISFGKRGR
jgi:hypothetical protein